jgi:hypothetical protein
VSGRRTTQPYEREPESVFIAQLRAELEFHLQRLDAERTAVREAIRALGAAGMAPTAAVRSLRTAVLDAIGGDPGVRATMLALTLGRRDEDVSAALRALESEHLVEHVGLGWVRREGS